MNDRAKAVEEPESRVLAPGWWLVDPSWELMRGPWGVVLIRRTQTPTFWRAWYRVRHFAVRAYYRAAWAPIRLMAKRRGISRQNFFNVTLRGAWQIVRAKGTS